MFPHKKTAGPAVAAERDRRQSGYSTTSAALRAAQPRKCLPPRGHSRDWDRSKGPTGVEPASHPCPLPGITPAVAWHTSNAILSHRCRVSVAVCPLYYCRAHVRFWPKSGENPGILSRAHGILYVRPLDLRLACRHRTRKSVVLSDFCVDRHVFASYYQTVLPNRLRKETHERF